MWITKKHKLIFFLLFLFLLLGANFVFAQPSFALEINYPRIPGAIPPQDFESKPEEERPSLYVKYIFNLVLWAAGIIALGGLIYGGILYLTSTGKPEAIISARNQITAAFFSLLLLLSSYLILKTISPQFVILKIPKAEPIEIIEKETIPIPEETVQSSIDVEMPFARIIEGKIFETYISEIPEPKEKKEPRMTRIKINASSTSAIAKKLREQNEYLKSLTEQCKCIYTLCAVISCTCDPCGYSSVRAEIQDTEKKNKEEINNLITGQIKTEEEVRLLKEELDRLKRAEKFIEDCPLRVLNSFAEFLGKQDVFKKENLILRATKFWDDINIAYNKLYNGKKKAVYDFGTFDCTISGTLGEEYALPTSEEEKEDIFTGKESEEEVGEKLKELAEKSEEVLSETRACSTEAPVGEIIDRAKRTTNLLIDKMEKLIEKDKELVDAVDRMHVLVSQCSSQKCYPVPYSILEMWFCWCAGEPCPSLEIATQLEKIQKIQEEIEHLIKCKCKEGDKPEEKKENAGIIFIINEIIPEILDDLEEFVRIPMKQCTEEIQGRQDIALLNCLQAKGATNPEGKVIHFCCLTEYWEKEKEEETAWEEIEKRKQTVFGDCFEECYLEKGQEKHRECVQKCLDRKGKEPKNKDLPLCFHRLNFYCCHE